MVLPWCSSGFLDRQGPMFHCNFWAKAGDETDDASASLFFAELGIVQYGEEELYDAKVGELRTENRTNWGNFGDSLGRSQVGTSIWPSIGGRYAQVFDSYFLGGFTSNLGAQNSSYAHTFSLQGVGSLLLTWASSLYPNFG